MKKLFRRKAAASILMGLCIIISIVPIIETSTAGRSDAVQYQGFPQRHHQIIDSQPIQQILPYSVASDLFFADSMLLTKAAKENRHTVFEKINELHGLSNTAYAYNAYDPSGGHVIGMISFDLDNPYYVDVLPPVGCGLISGADFLNETIMYFCVYDGGLFQYDIISHQAIFIGPTIPLLGLTYDALTDIWYASDTDNLYLIDITTGTTTLIGPFYIPTSMIDIAADLEGNLYGYNVLWTGDSTLYSVNKTTGLATAIGSMGYGFVYAQSMAYDRDNSIMYIAGYFNDGSPSALLICDVTTGQCTPVGNFEGGMEITGFAIPWSPLQYAHDIAVTNIIKPATGNAQPINPIVNVRNSGSNTEYNVPIQFTINKEQISGSIEEFETTNGSYLHFPKTPQPDTWNWGAPTSGPMAAHSGFNVWATNLAGNYPPNMWCILQTPPFIVQAGALFNFWHWYYFENNYDGGNVKITNDGGSTYTIITPVGGYPGAMPYNAYMTGQPAYNGQSGGWKQANFDLSAYEGQTVQIIFETASDSSVQYPGWYIDDVGFRITSWINEYIENQTIPMILPHEELQITFPVWTPVDLGFIENINLNYLADATSFFVDNNTNNNDRVKLFTLQYGFFDDVTVTQIISPVSGLATSQTPEVLIGNLGQNSENVLVTMDICKADYTTLVVEDFAGGVPPAGWGTNYPENWYSSTTNYAGGAAPEAQFSWSPSSVGEHLLYTGNIDTTGYTVLLLNFKEYVNDYNGDYTLKVVTSTDGGATWQDAYERAGGTYGPSTTEVLLSAENGVGSPSLQLAWDYSGDSFNINYWYIDDIWLGTIELTEEYNEIISTIITAGAISNVVFPEWTPADVPFATTMDYFVSASISMNATDGNPTDNELEELITLNYEHDVGITRITEPSWPLPIFIQGFYQPTEPWEFEISAMTFDTVCYDDFYDLFQEGISSVSWWGLSLAYNGEWYETNPDMIFNITFYEESSGQPGIIIETFADLVPSYYETVYEYDGFSMYEWSVDLPYSLDLPSGWISIQSQIPIDNGCFMWATGPYGAFNAYQLQNEVLVPIGKNMAFVLYTNDNVYCPGPGTYPVEGIVKNFGITYSEENVPVQARITNDTGVVIYDETMIVPGFLNPNQTAIVAFPDFTIPAIPGVEGDYKLTMKTILNSDDHPDNDKKTLTWIIQIPDETPPTTTATLDGTLGQHDWYISCVTVTLHAEDMKWPSGVNCTYYKVDDGPWNEYTDPIIICSDGEHTVDYYSDDKAGNIETIQSISFKIDQTAPSITMTVENVGFRQWKFLATVSDETSEVQYVECYIDMTMMGTIAAPGPYEWSWTGKGNHTVTGIAYDNAGNSATHNVIFSYSFNEFQPSHSTIFTLIHRIIQMFLSHHPFFSFLNQGR